MSLPSGYKRLEYIQSTGTQCINTELAENSVYGIRMKFTVPSLNVSWQSLVSGTLDTGFTVGSTTKTAGLYVRLRGDEVLKKDTALSSSVNELVIKGGKISINGAQVATYTAGALSSGSGQFYVFNNNAKSRYSNMFLYELELYDSSGATVRKYVASKRNSDNAIGMYDLVSNTFYGNAGTGTFTAGPVVVVIPEAPSNFRLSSSTENTATLSWDAVDGATGYKLYRDGTLISTMTETSYTDGIQPFTPYVYTLTAYNDNGESDPATISVQVIIPPETPSNFRVVSKSIMEISLAWDAVSGAESYQLSRDGVVIYTGEFPSYTDSGLTVDTTYTYTLSAVNTAGGSAETTLEAATTQFILVTDRTQADVDAGNAKGTYNASDLNRVGAAVRYVADLFHGLGYGFTVSPKTDWKETDWPTQSDIERYLWDVSTLRGLLTQMETTPNVPKSMEKLTQWTANDIEQILMDIDDAITRMKTSLFYASEIYSGEV